MMYCSLTQHIMQKTPVRVLHRRSPLAREKIIHWLAAIRFMKNSLTRLYICPEYLMRSARLLCFDFRMRLERICGHSQYFLLHLCTQVILP